MTAPWSQPDCPAAELWTGIDSSGRGVEQLQLVIRHIVMRDQVEESALVVERNIRRNCLAHPCCASHDGLEHRLEIRRASSR